MLAFFKVTTTIPIVDYFETRKLAPSCHIFNFYRAQYYCIKNWIYWKFRLPQAVNTSTLPWNRSATGKISANRTRKWKTQAWFIREFTRHSIAQEESTLSFSPQPNILPSWSSRLLIPPILFHRCRCWSNFSTPRANRTRKGLIFFSMRNFAITASEK